MAAEEGWFSLGKIALESIGCKLNQAETEWLARRFEEAGYDVVGPEDFPGVFLLNTCTVTHVADRKCRNLLRLAKRRNPRALVLAIGCYVERAPSEVARIDGVDGVVGNSDKHRIVDLVRERVNGRVSSGAFRGRRRFPTRARVKIQEGCSQHCSFCVVPSVRGSERSRSANEIMTDINATLADGCSEIVLTGTRIGRYDALDAGLYELVGLILEQTSVQRLRLSSLEPADLSSRLLGLWKNGRLCPHIHLPLQSGSDSVLMRMNRPYTTKEYQEAVSLSREAIPDLALTTDVMVGFPGETEEEFQESYHFCEQTGFARMHVFPYSARPGTPAAGLSTSTAIPDMKRRSQTMLKLAFRESRRFSQRFVGREMDVLWEGKKDDAWHGLTRNYLRVSLHSQDPLSNKILPARLTSMCDAGLKGELAIQAPQP